MLLFHSRPPLCELTLFALNTRRIIYFCACFFSLFSIEKLLAQSTPVLTNAAQLRALSADDAEKKLAVKLRAVITTFDPNHNVFIQDETGGTFINTVRPNSSLAPGDLIEVTGVTYPGYFVSGINPEKITRLLHGPLPAPVPVTFDDLLSTRWHYQRVEVSGIVRSVAPVPAQQRFILKLAMGARKLEVQIVAPGITNLPPLVNAQVRIDGLAAGYLNYKRQLIAPQLIVSQPADLHVESVPPTDPFDAPLTAFGKLLNFDPNGISHHRVRIRGIVAHQQPGEAIFLRDDGRGLLVQTTQRGDVRPGDEIEVVGFPMMGHFSAFLEDAEFRVIGKSSPPRPIETTVADALQGTNDANLITLSAQLLQVLDAPVSTVLVLREGDAVFRARLPRASLSFRNGSRVRLSGVCLVEESSFASPGFLASPRTIELLLRSPADIEVISSPSWWTTQRLVIAVSVLLGFGLTALFWIVLLGRRVARQAKVIREKVQREATLEERHRMAREMHDTLAQSFSGLGFQLDAINVGLPSNADSARQGLETARKIVRHGQEDFRRSLMNLRAEELERGSLGEALPEFARNIVTGTGIELHCNISRPPRDLPEPVENNLLRIGQECLTNAVRHARPKKISVTLSRQKGSVQLRIEDDGAGFDPEQLKHAANGHFGWRGIRERAEQIHGKVELKSQPGRGTVVTVTIPI